MNCVFASAWCALSCLLLLCQNKMLHIIHFLIILIQRVCVIQGRNSEYYFNTLSRLFEIRIDEYSCLTAESVGMLFM